MMKFFRKHNKELLAVFMALLMIVFVGGTALQNLLAPRYDIRRATCDYGEITNADLARATSTLEILRPFANWGQLGFRSGRPEPLDWHLLREEADAAGLIPDISAVMPTPDQVDQLRTIQSLARGWKIKPEVIYRALAELKGIRLAEQLLTLATVPGEAGVRTAIHNGLEKAKVRGIALPASAFIDDEAEFTDAELEAQLALYRDTEAGRGLNFGYVVPPSVKVEYIKVDAKLLGEKLPDQTVLKRARRYFKKNPNDPRFLRESDEEESTEEEAADAADTLEADDNAEGVSEADDASADEAKEDSDEAETLLPEWEEAKDIAIEIVREEEGKARAMEFANLLVTWAREPWDYAERDSKTRFRKTPDEAKREGLYASLIERLGKRKRMDLTDVVTVETTDFVPRDRVSQIPGLGIASFRRETGPTLFARSLMVQVEPIVGEMPTGQGVNPDNYLALLETAVVPFRGVDGEWYVIRVIDVKDKHPAENLAEVRDRVEKDLRTLKAYEAAKRHAETLLAALPGLEDTEEANRLQQALDANEALQTVIASPGGTRVKAFEPEPFGRVDERSMARGRQSGGMMSGSYVSPEFGFLPYPAIDEIFTLGEGGEGSTGVIEVKDNASVFVVEWVGLEPCREDQYEDQREMIMRQMMAFGRFSAMNDWFNSENLQKRCGLKWTGGE